MRKPRTIQDNAFYHVTARANRSEFIFEKDVIKDLFINVLRESRKKFKFKIKHFCIMDNHIHLIIKPEKGYDLSKIMQWILSVFAIRFNKFYKLHGHVWYDRFRSKIIKTFHYYLQAFDYISNNPVKAGVVEKAEDYKYSGLRFLRDKILDLID